MSSDQRCHTLYRFYTATGQLLYVGITMNPPERFKKHKEEKPWWPTVSGITVETYESRSALMAAERRAIKVEKPMHNVVHNGARKPNIVTTIPAPQPPPAAPAEPTSRIVYRCSCCGRSIANGTGYIHVSYSEMHEVQQAWRDLKAKKLARGEVFPDDSSDLLAAGISPQAAERMKSTSGELLDGCFSYSGAELMALPMAAKWKVHHAACDPDPDGSDYHVDVGRADTHERLLSWTAHLLEKSWIQDTNWSEFIYSVLSPRAAAV